MAVLNKKVCILCWKPLGKPSDIAGTCLIDGQERTLCKDCEKFVKDTKSKP